MSIVVVGGGSVGSYLAASISRERECYLLVKKGQASRYGTNVGGDGSGTNVGGDGSGTNIDVGGIEEFSGSPIIIEEITEAANVELIILAVKSYDITAVMAMRDMVPDDVPFLTIQNGLNAWKRVADMVGEDRVLVAVTSHGFLKKSDLLVLHTGGGRTFLGTISEGMSQAALLSTASLLDSAGLKCLISENIMVEVWKKGIINACINPITALYKIENGAILEESELLELSSDVYLECEEVARKNGIDISSGPGPKGFDLAKEVMKRTSTNHSSMLQDMLAGRKTEIEDINGAFAAFGRQSGVETPVNSRLTVQIKAAEEQGETRRYTKQTKG